MNLSHAKAVLGVAALATMLAFGTTASAAPISKCNAAKKKCIGKYIAAVMGCHAKAEGKSLAVDGTCLSKAAAKITGNGKGCFDKADSKNDGCSQTNDASAQLADADAFILDVVDDIDPNYPTPHTNKCAAGEKKCVGKKASGLMGCKAKENKDGIGDPNCEPKIEGKFTNLSGKGCIDKLLLKNDGPCGPATAAGLEAKIDAWADASADGLDGIVPTPTPTPTATATATLTAIPTPTATSTPAGGVCGDGIFSPGEDCDLSAGVDCQTGSNTAPGFACNSCQCACPSTVTFTGDATSPFSILDTGWNGIGHRAPIISNGTTTVSVSCAASSRPCGTCAVSGPVENPQANAGQLAARRCSNDTSIHCTNNTPCTPGGGTCQTFFGGPLALSAGAVSVCVFNQFNGSVSGTANVETGEAETTAILAAAVFNGIGVDNPCPRCLTTCSGGANDGLPCTTDSGCPGGTCPAGYNDGVLEGTCDDGTRAGLPCDPNGEVPGRPDFGRTSLDCPMSGSPLTTLRIDLSNKTSTVTKTLTTASPNCRNSAYVNEKCLCDTCNNLAADPCFTNADCPDPAGPIGPICGGRRCRSGPNNGQACNAGSECPSGSCSVPGLSTAPTGCSDDTNNPGNTTLECADGDGDGVGECTSGPVDQLCTLASGHAQRGCTLDSQCGGAPLSCGVQNRTCFPTGGGTFQPLGKTDGSDTLFAIGMADAPMNDVSHPTLAAVFCSGPTGLPAVDTATALPGPARVTLNGTAAGAP